MKLRGQATLTISERDVRWYWDEENTCRKEKKKRILKLKEFKAVLEEYFQAWLSSQNPLDDRGDSDFVYYVTEVVGAFDV